MVNECTWCLQRAPKSKYYGDTCKGCESTQLREDIKVSGMPDNFLDALENAGIDTNCNSWELAMRIVNSSDADKLINIFYGRVSHDFKTIKLD